MFGLGNGDSSANFADIEFSLYLVANGSIQIYEAGVSRGSFGTYATGDRVQVAVEGGAVKYKKNGATFYTSTLTPTYPLLVDSSLYTQGATLRSAQISGNWTAAPSSPPLLPARRSCGRRWLG